MAERPTRRAGARRADVPPVVDVDERHAAEALARANHPSHLGTERLVDVVLRASARERLRAHVAPPRDPALAAELAADQAETIVRVVTEALAVLELDPSTVFRARELVAAGLRAAAAPPEPAAFLASLSPTDKAMLRDALEAELARRKAEGDASGVVADRHDGPIVAPDYQGPPTTRASG